MGNKVKLILVAGSLSLLLSACGEKKATGQVVAVVNGEEISQEELNAEFQAQAINPGADKKTMQNAVLARLIERKLLAQKAKADGLDKTPEYIIQRRRIEDDLAINMLSQKLGKTVALPDAAAVSRFIANNPTLFKGRKRYTLDQIAFAPPSNMAVLRQLEPAHSLEAVAAALTTAGIKFTQGSSVLDTATVPPALAQRIASLPPGEPFVVPAGGRFVVSVVKSVQDVPTADSEAQPAAIELIRRTNIESTVRKELEAARAAAKIEYRSDFGPPAKGAPKPAASPAASAPGVPTPGNSQ